MPADKEVAIIGAGIAGLTCALRLSKRGYKVTLYEKDGMLGGDLSSKQSNGMYHDVYTHLFCDWYVNFWRIVEDDLKIKRDDAFEPRMSITILNEVWCISSSDTSAAAYKDFVKHVLGSRGLPFAWLLRGSLEEMLIRPWQESLKNDCNISASVEVTAIEVGDDDKVQLTLSDNTKATHANVVLAVPAPELAKLVMTGRPGRSVVERLPALSELQRLRTASILVVTVFFKEKLPNIPREHVGLARSQGYLTFIDISQLWTSLSNIKEQHTVLILAASDAYAYPSPRDEEWAHVMIQELAGY